MDTEIARQKFEDIKRIADEGLAALTTQAPEFFTVRAGESLKAALLQPLPIATEDGAIFEGVHVIPSSTRIVFGAGSGCKAINGAGPALYVKPGTVLVDITGGDHSSDHPDSVIAIGENSAYQLSLEAQPEVIILRDVAVSRHRGKRALALHCYRARVERFFAPDTWSTRDQDSQAIYIGNARGEIDILDSTLGAGSEIILSGGDRTRTPGLIPTGIRIRRNNLIRPLSWRTDADSTKRRIKNSLELKSALQVEITDNLINGNWEDLRVSQGAYAIMLTPALDGADKTTPPEKSGIVGDVLIENNLFLNVGSGINIIGRDYRAVTDPAVYGVKIRRNRFRIDKKAFGGFGQFLKLGGEPNDVEVSGNAILQNGSSHVIFYKGDVLDPVTGVSRSGGKLGSLTYASNLAELGGYGFNLDGDDNALAEKWALNVGEWALSGNTYSGAARKGPLGGVFLPVADFEQLPEVLALRAL